MKYLIFPLLLSIALSFPVNAEPKGVEKRLYDLEHKVQIIDSNQLNYQIEKDLLKDTYSANYENTNLVITFILGMVGIFGFFGLRDISGIKKEYEKELSNLKSIQNQFELKSKDFDSEKDKLNEELKSIIEVNQEQSQNIKFIELKDRMNTLFNDKRISSALEFANAALEIKPTEPEILNIKGAILVQQCQIEDAVPVFRKAVLENPDDSSSIINLVECLYFANEIVEAKKFILENKDVFEKKRNKKVVAFLALIECYYNSEKDKLIETAKSYVDIDNLKIKERMIKGWSMREARMFAQSLDDGELKNIIRNIIWYWDGEITGEQLLTRLDIPLPE